jgi:GDPmannose 4,6-dehydratase
MGTGAMRTAIVIGSGGQDGRLLTALLKRQGCRVLGIMRAAVEGTGLAWPGPVDITRYEDVAAVVKALQPDEIYHLAAIHHSSEEDPPDSLDGFRRLYEVNFFSLLNFLEAVRVASPESRLFFAASSHVFGRPPADVQDESTPLSPDSVYAMTKADGLVACRLHRERHGLFASAGILYTHESSYRDEKFLSMKIVRAVLRIKAGHQRELVLGDLDATIDWGFAEDYVEAMQRIIGAAEPAEFIVASGAPHAVREFVAVAFEAAGLDWRRHVREDAAIVTRRTPVRIGDPRRLKDATGWRPRTGFEDMIRSLLRSEGLGR